MAGLNGKTPYLVTTMFLVVIASPFLTLVQADSGLVSIDEGSINIDEFLQINTSSVVVYFDVIETSGFDAIVEINFELRTLEGEVLEQLIVNQTFTGLSQLNLSHEFTLLPYGLSLINVSLSGDIGQDQSSSFQSVTTFERSIQRLRPLNVSIASSSSIYFDSVDQDGHSTGNLSIADGDFFIVSIPLHNEGNFNWTGGLWFNTTGSLLSSTYEEDIRVNSTSSTIIVLQSQSSVTEGILDWTIHLSNVSGVHGVHQQHGQIEIQPPPLPLLSIFSDDAFENYSAGDTVLQSFTIWNNGSVDYAGTIVCSIDNYVISEQNISVFAEENFTVIVEYSIRPGIFSCNLAGQRFDSSSTHAYVRVIQVESAEFEIIGSTQPIETGGPWFSGDVYRTSLLLRNVGTKSGTIALRMDIGGEEHQSEMLHLEPMSAGELSLEFELPSAGSYVIDWDIFTEDGALLSTGNGQYAVNISSSQELLTQIEDVSMSREHGIGVEATLFLSDGPSREVHISYGTYTGTVEEQIGEFELLTTPGIVTLEFNLGLKSSEGVFVIATPSGWKADVERSVSMVESPYEDAEYSITLDPLITPRRPLQGDDVELEVMFTARGDFLSTQSTYSILAPSGEILFSAPVPSFSSNEEQVIAYPTIMWPKGDEVTLRVIWLIDGLRFETESTFQSGESIADEQSSEIPFLEAFYGVVLAGVVVFAVRIFQNRDQTSMPNTSSRSVQRKDDAEDYSKEEKKTISCPECARQLRIPQTYVGKVRCPDCEHGFDTSSFDDSPTHDDVSEDLSEQVKEEQQPEANDGKKEISCPDCARTLRVPNSYNGSVRCPACKSVFKAT